MFKKLIENYRKNKLPDVLELTPNGYRITKADDVLVEVKWADVQEVFAFKKDLLAVDLICIGFRTDAAGTYYVIHEELPGYKETCSQLPKVFEGIQEDWFADVAFPPFETNLITLWGQEKMSKIFDV